MEREGWSKLTEGFGARIDLSFAAVNDANEIVGLCLSHRYTDDDAILGESHGRIESLATLHEWRGRGIASALLLTAMRAYKREGLTHASLSVDGDSPTGANQLYESHGFSVVRRTITYNLELDPLAGDVPPR